MKRHWKLIVLVLCIGLAMAAAGAGGAWWLLRPKAPETKTAKPVEMDHTEYKYINLEKVIVMLRGKEGEPMSHYLAVDLVFKTALKNEKMTREHLPLLRAVAVKALSGYTMDKAGQMTVEQFAQDINRAFSASYAAERTTKPFTEAMIGKLIIE
ncbi:flagellar basal body-associated FliL family protein [Uliginosibacterium sp. sgz301328]|uniref:flagellar basal body-associated FliL family protein n=1 Tax=Uliginosibacterium sp. sgz301328 TaxID=3243764 RepID=UPI00359E87E7